MTTPTQVSVDMSSDKTAVLRGVVNDDFHVVCTISAEERETSEKRAPIELCLVVDVSGSMSGDKLRFATEGVCSVLDELNEDDVVHLVTYENSASVVFASGNLRNREALKAQARQMHARGGTNIRSGLITGALAMGAAGQGAIFAKYSEREGVVVARDVDNTPRLKRIFLFSDGQANHDNGGPEGLGKLAAEIMEAGVTITAFGIGIDFDEVVMDRISKVGQGAYEYIKKPKDVAPAVVSALGSMKALLGTNLQLKVRGKGVAVVKKIFNHPGTAVAELNDLRAGGKKNVVIQLSLSPSDLIPSEHTSDILEYSLEWLTVDGQTEGMTGSFSTKMTCNVQDVQSNGDAEAVVLTLKAGVLDDEVVELLDKGDRAGAVTLKKHTVELLERASELQPQGMAPVMLKMARKNVAHLESKRSTNKMKKAVAYGGRLQRSNSISCLNQMATYAAASSSEEEDDDYHAPPLHGQTYTPSAPSMQQMYAPNNYDSISDDDSKDSN